MNVQDAVDAPRVHHQWQPDKLSLERGISPDTVALLKSRGYEVDYSAGVVLAQVAAIVSDGGWLQGASDGRFDRRQGGRVLSRRWMHRRARSEHTSAPHEPMLLRRMLGGFPFGLATPTDADPRESHANSDDNRRPEHHGASLRVGLSTAIAVPSGSSRRANASISFKRRDFRRRTRAEGFLEVT